MWGEDCGPDGLLWVNSFPPKFRPRRCEPDFSLLTLWGRTLSPFPFPLLLYRNSMVCRQDAPFMRSPLPSTAALPPLRTGLVREIRESRQGGDRKGPKNHLL